MKLTQKQLTDLLASLGVKGVEVVDDETQSEFNADSFLTAIDANREPILQSKFRDGLTKEIQGRQGGILRGLLTRATGMSRKELDDIEADADAIKAAIDHQLKLVEGDKQQVKDQLDQVLANHAAEIQKLAQEKDAEIAAANEKYIDRDVTEYYLDRLNGLPISEKADKKFIAGLWKEAMKASHHVKYDEQKRGVSYYNKDKTDNLSLNESGTGPIDDTAILKDIATKIGAWETDTRNLNPLDQLQKKTGPEEYVPAGLANPQQNPNLASFNDARAKAMAAITQ